MSEHKLKVGFFTPYFHQVRGNATTAKRIVAGLHSLNIDVFTFAYEEEKFSEACKNEFESCDIIHILHFSRFANWQIKHQFTLNKPYIITSGGTDINIDISDKLKKQNMSTLIDNASAITVFTEDGRGKVEHAFPNRKGNIFVIPQSVWFPPTSEKNDKLQGNVPTGYPIVLLPAGLRPVKDVLFVMDAFIHLREEFPSLQFTIVGTVLDKEVYREVQRVTDKYSWVKFIENVPLENMPPYYKWGDVILNSSISEGQSSAIIEGMFFEKLIFARKNAGNVSIITDRENGILYDNPVDFTKSFIECFSDEMIRKEIALNGKRYVEKYHSHKTEIQKYYYLYKKII